MLRHLRRRYYRRNELGSAQVIAHIDATILEYGYGCDVELIPGDTMPTSTSLIEKGEPSIAPELWSQT